MQPDDLAEIIDSLNELKRLHQLNIELIEQLAITCDWLRKQNIVLPNQNTFDSLLNRATALIDEIQADAPKTLVYYTSRRKVTDFRTDEEEPIPTHNGELQCLWEAFAAFRVRERCQRHQHRAKTNNRDGKCPVRITD